MDIEWAIGGAISSWLEMIKLSFTGEEGIECLKRLLCAVALSAIVGYERQRKGRPAGIRTHILVCLGATLLMIVSDAFANEWMESGAAVWMDRGRIAQGIVTGVGFLGAGTIVNYGRDQHGLTTAAMIWFVAAVGIAVGAGMYMLATVSTLLATFIVLVLDTPYGLKARVYYTLKVTLNKSDLDMDGILKRLRDQKMVKVRATGFELNNENERVIVEFAISAKSSAQYLSIQDTVIKQLPEALDINFNR